MATAAKAMAALLERRGVDLAVVQSLPSALHQAVADRAMRRLRVRTENVGMALCDVDAKACGRPAAMTDQNGSAATLLDALPDTSQTVSRAFESH